VWHPFIETVFKGLTKHVTKALVGHPWYITLEGRKARMVGPSSNDIGPSQKGSLALYNFEANIIGVKSIHFSHSL
jgi:hypothetical protein